jgi:hypothetical protein
VTGSWFRLGTANGVRVHVDRAATVASRRPQAVAFPSRAGAARPPPNTADTDTIDIRAVLQKQTAIDRRVRSLGMRVRYRPLPKTITARADRPPDRCRATRVPQDGVSDGQQGSLMTTASRRSSPRPGHRCRVPKLSINTRASGPPLGSLDRGGAFGLKVLGATSGVPVH